MLLFQMAMAVTFCLGAGLLALEMMEFYDLIDRGISPSRSAFLSGFFTLVGCHGLHVSVGLLWLLTMMAQVLSKGFRADIVRRTLCFALFWHALDIVWVGDFSVVYLMRSIARATQISPARTSLTGTRRISRRARSLPRRISARVCEAISSAPP
jgi:cytochrome o ubiquinol oxidase subunit 3